MGKAAARKQRRKQHNTRYGHLGVCTPNASRGGWPGLGDFHPFRMLVPSAVAAEVTRLVSLPKYGRFRVIFEPRERNNIRYRPLGVYLGCYNFKTRSKQFQVAH